MHRLSIQFYNDIFQKLQVNADKKDISLARYVRELVEIGLRIEELSARHNDKNNKTDDSQNLWKTNLQWSLESLYIVRCLMNDLLPHNSEQYLTTAKQKAHNLVEKLLHKESEVL